ncbi:hypothetical protein V5734_07375 [Defluviimonas sp. SAOS-178_SWC]
MKASKFTEAQKAFILKQGDAGTPVAESRNHRVQGRRRPDHPDPQERRA